MSDSAASCRCRRGLKVLHGLAGLLGARLHIMSKSTSQTLDRRRRRLILSSISIISIAAPLITLMASQTSVPAPSSASATSATRAANAKWTDEELNTIAEFMFDHKSTSEGNGNFKAQIYRECVLHLAHTHPKLPAKDKDQTKRKWGDVRRPLDAANKPITNH